MDFRNPQGPLRLALAGFLITIVALVDWRVEAPIAFGFLYLFPILLVGTVARRWHVIATALLCMALADVFSPLPFSPGVSLPQDVLVFTSLAGTGLFAYEATRSRQREQETLRRLEKEVDARREAEEQLEFLIESSPVAILTMAGDCLIGRANPAAHRLLRVPAGQLAGRSIRRYIPALGRVPFRDQTAQTFRTEMQCRGERENGEALLANVFFSTYNTAVGPRLAALVVDAAEELRDREETSLEQLMTGSRILVGAVSHEVRNVCGAIGVIYENLVRNGTLRDNRDFEARGNAEPHRSARTEADGRKPAGGRDRPHRHAQRPADRAGAVLPGGRYRGALGHPAGIAAGVGRPAQPVAGAAEPDQ